MICPYKSYDGHCIRVGDRMVHQDGVEFTVVYDGKSDAPWRAVYDDGDNLWLSFQVNGKGQAIHKRNNEVKK